MRVAEVKDNYSTEEFNKLFKEFKHDTIAYNRLVFIRSIRNGNTIKNKEIIKLGNYGESS